MPAFPTLVVYELAPIDHWSGWIDLNTHDASKFASPYDDAAAFGQMVDAMLDEAKFLAETKLGWEGDVHQGPFLSSLPYDQGGHCEPMIGWKQSNNGTTYIASLSPLDYLTRAGWTSAKH
jgi:hypothetical protein